ncbi:MAG: DUF1329 domain-containing protein [Pseudomonadota bacterium]
MLNVKLTTTAAAAVLSVLAQPLAAAVSADEAARLGSDQLTPIGAERAGNADGSIPAWEPLASPPAGFVAGKPLVDPYADEEPLFTITAANHEQYKDKLSAGQIGMLKRYPDTYRLPVYPSHRIAEYPPEVYEKIKANATVVETVEGGNGITNNESDCPFPIPANGTEVIWNHILRFRGGSVKRTYTQIPVQKNASFSPIVFEDQVSWANQLDGDIDANRLFFYKQRIDAPARLEGNVLLVHENLNQVAEPRAAWLYNAGQRRVRRAPDVAYDGPGTAADGLRTSDDLDLFNGALDRYDWELIGKREMYIGGNNYKLLNKDVRYKDMLGKGHINPDYLRYELRRVWVVDAKLKDGKRHVYSRRTFYIDEDTWQIVAVDQYDGRGQLWRVKEAHSMTHYHVKVPWYAVEVQYDLVNGRYLPIGLENELSGYTYEWNYKTNASEYTPSALRRAGRG